MVKRIVPSPETLRELLRYEPDTGKLYWKERPRDLFKNSQSWKAWNTRYAGQLAFTSADSRGYLRGAIFGDLFLAHRVAWAIAHGRWPEKDIDHVNGDPSDNNLMNLREATRTENACNRGKQRNNTSGYKGVGFHKASGKWRSYIVTSDGQMELGLFRSPEEAHCAYMQAANEYHREFANYG